jgi:hypothetical protein
VQKQISAFRLGIQACDLIWRHDLDLWLPVAKSDCARNADGFSLDHGQVAGRLLSCRLQISPSGSLTPVPGSSFAAGIGPHSVIIDSEDRFVYVVNEFGNSISEYRIDSSGALAPIPGSPGRSRCQQPSLKDAGLFDS